MLKLLLSFEHGAIPATLHQHQLNPMLAPFAKSFVVTGTTRPWPRSDRPRIAAVTSLGMSGTNAHALIEEPPSVTARATPEIERAHLLCLSARSEAALAVLARRYADHLHADASSIGDVCYTASVGRAHFAHRLGIATGDRATLIERLREHANGDAPSERAPTHPPKIGFLFTGQGSQYVGMGRRLYETQRTFRQALQRCAEVLQPLLPRPLLEVLFAQPRAGELTLDDTALAQPALFALEWSLAELWRSWGIEPAFVLGHSLGEYVAACVAGVFSVEEGLRLAAERGRLMQALPRDGAMVALGTDEATVQAAIGHHAGRVSVSGINGPRAVVLSGEQQAVAEIAAALAGQGVSTKSLRVSHAFHSPLMESILEPFERMVASVKLAAPRIAFISTLSGRRENAETLSTSSYWRRQIREPVRFSEAMAAMVAEGAELIVELGPSPILLAMGQSCLANARAPRAWLPSLRREHDDWEQILGRLGELYVHGVEPRWPGLWREPTQRKVVLPTYPFERQRYWSAPRAVAARVETTSARAPERESPRMTLLRELGAAPLEERVQQLMQHVRAVLAGVLGRAPESLSAEHNLLEEGLDSLRVMDFLGRLRKRVALELSPAEFMARPSLAAFATYAAKAASRPSRLRGHHRAITLNGSGSAVPIFCMHPSGGEITAYLRLRTLLGDDHPLYAIQSRATGAPRPRTHDAPRHGRRLRRSDPEHARARPLRAHRLVHGRRRRARGRGGARAPRRACRLGRCDRQHGAHGKCERAPAAQPRARRRDLRRAGYVPARARAHRRKNARAFHEPHRARANPRLVRGAGPDRAAGGIARALRRDDAAALPTLPARRRASTWRGSGADDRVVGFASARRLVLAHTRWPARGGARRQPLHRD